MCQNGRGNWKRSNWVLDEGRGCVVRIVAIASVDWLQANSLLAQTSAARDVEVAESDPPQTSA
jgi:hypothetical protein